MLTIVKALIEFDEWGNFLLGGTEEETISSHSYRAKLEGKWLGKAVPFIDWLFYKGHCQNAYESWLKQNESNI